MTKQGFQVRLAGDPTYLAATPDKKAVAYIRVVEDVWAHQDGKYVERDPNWYDARFEGKQAEAVMENFSKGDNLLVLGNTKTETTMKDGTEYTNVKLFVDHFNYDPVRSKDMEMVRQPKAGQAAVQERAAELKAEIETGKRPPRFDDSPMVQAFQRSARAANDFVPNRDQMNSMMSEPWQGSTQRQAAPSVRLTAPSPGM